MLLKFGQKYCRTTIKNHDLEDLKDYEEIENENLNHDLEDLNKLRGNYKTPF